MTKDEFEDQLRVFVRRQPFEPFVVRLKNGDAITVLNPEEVAFGGGNAGFVRNDGELALIHCSEVDNVSPGAAEAQAAR